MTDNTNSNPDNDRAAGALAPRHLDLGPSAGPCQGDVVLWGGPPGQDRDEPRRGAGGGTNPYVHALRRRWPLAIALGILCAAAAAVPAWFLAVDQYTATALLQVSANEQQLVFATANQASASPFEIYKGTQQQLLASDVVLNAALHKPEVAGLTCVRKEDNPARWLAHSLRVEYPGNAEILRVSMTGSHPKDVAVLVESVVDAYMNEIADAERNRQTARLDELNRLYKEKEEEMRTRRTGLKQLAQKLGTGDGGALALKQQIILQQYAEARNDLARLRSELQRARDDLRIKQAWLTVLKSSPQHSQDPDSVADNDPVLSRLSDQVDEIDTRLAHIQEETKEPLRSQLTSEYNATKKALAKRAETRRKELIARYRKNGKSDLDPLIVELTTRIEILVAQEKAAATDLAEQRQKAEMVGNSSVDLEMMRSELQYLDKVLAPIGEEREKLKVELNSTPRISVVQHAEIPRAPSSKPRLPMTAGAGLGGFFGAIVLVLWRDARKQRIGSLVDLSRGLGLTVVGALPRLPQRMLAPIARAETPPAPSRDCLDHAVDAIAARLFLRRDDHRVRVLMVSSAQQGEGKTTLSVQLARCLARTGARTLLVDFDLRRPSIHRIFNMPRAPGVNEFLHEGLSLAEAARTTMIEGLSVITAGNSHPDSLGALTSAATTALFEQVRDAYTFVVVDASPILPVIDGLLVSQHADMVVLTVRRDASMAPQILRACEKLSAFGSRKYVAVLNGSREEVFGNYYDQILVSEMEGAENLAAATVRPS